MSPDEVTEKLWTGLINANKIASPFSTTVVHRLQDVVRLLQSAPAEV